MPLPRTLNLPPTGWTLAGLLAFYVLAGLFGHDPWKSEDVVHLAIARHLLESGPGSGLVLAGQPFFHAPLYYWSAALTGFLFGGMFPLHDALRLASGGWMALTLMTGYYTAREYYGQDSAAAAPLLLAGSFGLIVTAHEAQPMLVLLAAVSLQLLACSLLLRKPGTAALLLALAFMLAGASSGSAGLFLMVMLLALDVLIKTPPRTALGNLMFFLVGGGLLLTGTDVPFNNVRLFLLGILILSLDTLCEKTSIRPTAYGILGSALLMWLLTLWLASTAPEWFQGWITQERSFFSTTAYLEKILALARMLPLFSWPLLPLACWSLWQKRRKGQWRQPEFLAPLLALGLLFFGLPLLFPIREHTAMLLLPPLALLATPGALALRRGAANAFDWFSGMAFSVFVLLLWIGWSAMVLGWPARLAKQAVKLNPGFVGHFDLLPFLLALAGTLWWIWSLAGLPRSPYRCLTRWTAGLVIGWLLAVSLWLPWVDYGKSYRQLTNDLAHQIPKQEPCVSESNLGSAQRASFSYFAGLTFTPLDLANPAACRLLLTQNALPDPQYWEQIWQGTRPGDRKERFRLYQRR